MEITISCRDTKEKISGENPPTMIDCREQNEYDLVHISGAVFLPMSRIEASLGDLVGREEEHLIVYCHHGVRSHRVAEWLRSQGFAKAQSMSGGIDQWATDIEPGMTRY